MKTDEIISFFYRHIVPIVFVFQKDEEKYEAQISSFVISIKGKWFLVTAGHCLLQIDENIKNGYKFIKCGLVDSLGTNPKDHFYVHFTYQESKKLIIDESGLDIGLILLSDYYKELLQFNDVVALSEDCWESQPENPDSYALVGIPDLLIGKDKKGFEFHPAIFGVNKCESKPEVFPNVETPRFYGQINLEGKIDDIGGVSGSPIFAFKIDNQGKLRYWLIAVECSWLNESQYISGCYIKDVANSIGKILEKAMFFT